MKKRILQILFMSMLCVSVLADEDNPCSNYYFSCVQHNGCVLEYSVVGWQHVEEPYVDSIWITTTDNEVVMVSYAQPHEMIDLPQVPRGKYLVYAQVGECLFCRMIPTTRCWGYIDVGDELQEPKVQPHSTRMIINGQLLIRHGDKTYDAQGREIK